MASTKERTILTLNQVITNLFSDESEGRIKEDLIKMSDEGKIASHIREICEDVGVPDHSKKKFLYTYTSNEARSPVETEEKNSLKWNPLGKLRENFKQPKQANKKVTHACVHCQKNHTSCDNKRPCKRCTAKGMADLCVNAEGKIRGRKKTKIDVNRDDLSPEALNRTLEQTYCAGDSSNVSQWPPTLRTFSASEGAAMADRLQETIKLEDPMALEELFKKIQACEKRTRENRATVTAEQKDKMAKEFNFQLETFRQNCAQVEIPAFIWGLFGVIFYANQPFRNLTNWRQTSLPTKLTDFAFTDILGPEALYDFYVKVLSDILEDQGLTHRFWPGTLRVSPREKKEGVSEEEGEESSPRKEGGFIEGTFCVTIKRDIFGLPCLFYGHFLPSASELGVLGL